MHTSNIHVEEVDFSILTDDGISSSLSPFKMTDNVKPLSAVAERKLTEIYRRYNEVFIDLYTANRECEDDYRFNFESSGPINHIVQIDTNGGSSNLKSIFEIDNSIAMYQMLSKINPIFYIEWRRLLMYLNQKTGKPIALAAVTQGKYREM